MNKGESVTEGENRWNEMKLVTKEKSVEKKTKLEFFFERLTKLEIEGVTCWQCGAVDCGSSLQACNTSSGSSLEACGQRGLVACTWSDSNILYRDAQTDLELQ